MRDKYLIKFNTFLEVEINNQKLFNTKILWILMFQNSLMFFGILNFK